MAFKRIYSASSISIILNPNLVAFPNVSPSGSIIFPWFSQGFLNPSSMHRWFSPQLSASAWGEKWWDTLDMKMDNPKKKWPSMTKKTTTALYSTLFGGAVPNGLVAKQVSTSGLWAYYHGCTHWWIVLECINCATAHPGVFTMVVPINEYVLICINKYQHVLICINKY